MTIESKTPERFDDDEFLERLEEVRERVLALKWSLKGWDYMSEAYKALGWIAEDASKAIDELVRDFQAEFEMRGKEEEQRQ